MKHTITAVLFYACTLIGCVRTPSDTTADDAFWGPGTIEPDTLQRQMEYTIARPEALYGVKDTYQFIRGRYSVMSWDQAAAIYRNASIDLKAIMCHDIVEAKRFTGMTREQVVALIGEPDGRTQPGGEQGEQLIYTGEGHVSDSMSGYILNFDEEGVFSHIGYAN